MKEKLTIPEIKLFQLVCHCHKNNPIARRELAWRLRPLGFVAGPLRTVQKIVNSLRRKGYPILSSSTPGRAGYYWPRNEKELYEGIVHLMAPAYDTLKITSNMAGYFQKRKQMRLR
jgi:hypothetical protein